MGVTHSGGQLWNQAMQVLPPDDQSLNECTWCLLVAQFSADAGGTTLWPKLQLMQVAPPGGKIRNQCKWRHLVEKICNQFNGPGN